MLKQIPGYTLLLLLMIVSSSAFSVVELKEFSSDQQRERFHVLVNELRCPKCQNQNLADSNSPIASDLRTEIFRMLQEGKSDQEIVDFLVDRYGDFVLYRPPVKKTTLMLWLVPGLLLLIGVVVIFLVKRRQGRPVQSNPGLASDEQEQLNALLGSVAKQEPESDVETEQKDNVDGQGEQMDGNTK